MTAQKEQILRHDWPINWEEECTLIKSCICSSQEERALPEASLLLCQEVGWKSVLWTQDSTFPEEGQGASALAHDLLWEAQFGFDQWRIRETLTGSYSLTEGNIGSFFLLMGLGFELRAWHLQSRQSTTAWVTPPFQTSAFLKWKEIVAQAMKRPEDALIAFLLKTSFS
jgi:hypothetical protein